MIDLPAHIVLESLMEIFRRSAMICSNMVSKAGFREIPQQHLKVLDV